MLIRKKQHHQIPLVFQKQQEKIQVKRLKEKKLSDSPDCRKTHKQINTRIQKYDSHRLCDSL